MAEDNQPRGGLRIRGRRNQPSVPYEPSRRVHVQPPSDHDESTYSASTLDDAHGAEFEHTPEHNRGYDNGDYNTPYEQGHYQGWTYGTGVPPQPRCGRCFLSHYGSACPPPPAPPSTVSAALPEVHAQQPTAGVSQIFYVTGPMTVINDTSRKNYKDAGTDVPSFAESEDDGDFAKLQSMTSSDKSSQVLDYVRDQEKRSAKSKSYAPTEEETSQVEDDQSWHDGLEEEWWNKE